MLDANIKYCYNINIYVIVITDRDTVIIYSYSISNWLISLLRCCNGTMTIQRCSFQLLMSHLARRRLSRHTVTQCVHSLIEFADASVDSPRLDGLLLSIPPLNVPSRVEQESNPSFHAPPPPCPPPNTPCLRSNPPRVSSQVQQNTSTTWPCYGASGPTCLWKRSSHAATFALATGWALHHNRCYTDVASGSPPRRVRRQQRSRRLHRRESVSRRCYPRRDHACRQCSECREIAHELAASAPKRGAAGARVVAGS